MARDKQPGAAKPRPRPGRVSSPAPAPANLLTRLLRWTWSLFSRPITWLWRFTFQRWWNFLLSVPAIAALVAALGAVTIADLGVVIAVTVLVGVRAGLVELVKVFRKSAAGPTPTRRQTSTPRRAR